MLFSTPQASMHRFFIGIILCICAASVAVAEDTVPPKPKQPDKPRPDSAISVVLALPEVKQWANWMTSLGNGTSLTAWGETIKEVDGHKCWGIAVGEQEKDGVHIWRRFCVMQSGVEVWVESIQADPMDEIHYLTYDKWQSDCAPTPNSPGKC